MLPPGCTYPTASVFSGRWRYTWKPARPLPPTTRAPRPSPPRFSPVWIALEDENRQNLYARIDRRVDMMLEQGLLAEIQGLLAMGIPRKSTAMQAIGYKEFLAALDGLCTLEQAAELVKQSSRHYAKRQLTWFRRNKNIHWLTRNPGDPAEKIISLARQVIRESDN